MTTNALATTGTQVVADITVESCAPASGRQGNAQWQITADVPWSKYPERFWIDAVAGSIPIAQGVHHCAFSVGTQKPNTTGQVAFHYRFRLEHVDYVGGAYPDVMSLTFGSSTPPTAQPGNAPGSAPGSAPVRNDREIAIIRQSCMKAVMDAKVTAYNNATKLVADGHLIPDDNVSIAELIMLHAEGMVTNILLGSTPTWVDYMVSIINETHLQASEEDSDPTTTLFVSEPEETTNG